MSLHIERLPLAKADMAQIHYYISMENAGAADRFLVALHASLVHLAEFPESGRVREMDIRSLAGVRSWGVTGFLAYLIMYRIEGGSIVVYRVLHGARDIHAALLE